MSLYRFYLLAVFSGHYDYKVVHVKIAICRPIVLKSKRIHVAVFDFDGEVGVFLFFTLIAFVIDSATSLDGVFGFIITGIDAFVLLKRVILAQTLYFPSMTRLLLNNWTLVGSSNLIFRP